QVAPDGVLGQSELGAQILGDDTAVPGKPNEQHLLSVCGEHARNYTILHEMSRDGSVAPQEARRPDMQQKSMMILIAGPYRSGTGDDPAKMARNLRALEQASWPIFEKGHVPMIGEWAALPIWTAAG